MQSMNLLFMIAKVIHELEARICYYLSRLTRGTFGYAVDAKLSDIQILYDSPHFIVISKRHDVIINHEDKTVPVTVEKQLERLYPDLVNPSLPFSFFFCHRLDYSTSGILCIAKHKNACAAAVKAFSSRNVNKFYLAIVRGHVSKNLFSVNEGIGEDIRESYRAIKMATQSSPFCTSKWRKATTYFAVLEKGYCYNYPATKVVLKPITGRRHQLRVHCSHIGHTIVGDYTYSNRKDLLPYRMFLHAYKIIVPNKIDSLNITTEDPFTEDFKCNHWVMKEVVFSLEDAIKHLNRGTFLS